MATGFKVQPTIRSNGKKSGLKTISTISSPNAPMSPPVAQAKSTLKRATIVPADNQ